MIAEGGDARRDQASAAPDPGVDGEDEEPDRDGEEDRQRVIAEREGEDDGGADEVPVGAVGPAPTLPGDEQPQEDGDEGEVERVCLGVGGDRPGDRGQRHRHPGGHPDGQPAGQPTNEVDAHPGRDRQADGGQQVHPERRLSECLECHGCDPADQDVRREPGRVRRPHERSHGLQLTGIPERQPREQGGPGGREGDHADEPRGQDADPTLVHHPRIRLQSTPQALTATDRTTTLIPASMPHLWRTAIRSNPSATRSSANGAASLLNR